MKAPKILPWIAKRAGIGEDLALDLWHRAEDEARHLTGKSEGSEYWGLAVDRFLLLVEEAAVAAPPCHLEPAPRLSWMWHHQSRMSLLSLVAAQNAYHYWQSAWDSLSRPAA